MMTDHSGGKSRLFMRRHEWETRLVSSRRRLVVSNLDMTPAAYRYDPGGVPSAVPLGIAQGETAERHTS